MFALLIFLLFLLKHQATQNQQVTGSASEPILDFNITYTIPTRTPINMTCSANFSLSHDTRNATLTIYKDGKLLERTMVNLTKGGSVNYRKQKAEFSDSGQYSCKLENEDNNNSKDITKNVSILEPVSKPKLTSNTTTTSIGHNVTLSCLSNGSLPINYTFFRQITTLSHQMLNESKAAKVTVHIKSTEDTGPYKCKAANRLHSMQKYSRELNLTIAEKSTSYTTLTACIVTALLLIAIALSVVVAQLILRKRKARGSRADPGNNKPKSLQMSEPGNAVEATAYDSPTELQYATMLFNDTETVPTRKDTSVEYAEILVKNHHQKA